MVEECMQCLACCDTSMRVATSSVCQHAASARGRATRFLGNQEMRPSPWGMLPNTQKCLAASLTHSSATEFHPFYLNLAAAQQQAKELRVACLCVAMTIAHYRFHQVHLLHIPARATPRILSRAANEEFLIQR